MPATAGGAYLIDEFQIDHALSLAAVDLGLERDWRGEPVLLVRTDVPGALEERGALRAVWTRARVTELAEAAATEAAVPAAVAQAGIVHFATHAEASDRDPLATHLRLSPGANGDGLLHVGEIAPRSYEERLVVLASCESLVGALLSGEGFVGLSRAFVAGGASGVVAARWPIGASSASFTRVFYAALARGRSFAAATREAQLSLRSRPETANPFFWGGYVAVQGVSARRSAP
jgi:CHAT domain-containing protein